MNFKPIIFRRVLKTEKCILTISIPFQAVILHTERLVRFTKAVNNRELQEFCFYTRYFPDFFVIESQARNRAEQTTRMVVLWEIYIYLR